ncbi:ATP-binding protein [Paenibacillus barcinonensis]|uniref:ATP-binding protein n=1 Tax=Paenibacillus barcinonensis TaxID=198119 RepID=A0A2V4V9T6_PAEBA|nr:ATP-binding protein [Paenibacillus barcinonensis]PYE48831.1 anti-sigma regulatory factor (Ser/Thr protein kinase) [Paenibacillus barcinonensis]QKS57743.1 ATP-binding protein [Paenibacillus barcinonensis]
MDNWLQKIFGRKHATAISDASSDAEPLPSLYAYHQQFILEWLFKRMKLELQNSHTNEERSGEDLSLSPVQLTAEETAQLEYLASSLFNWLGKNDDVYLKLRQLKLGPVYMDLMLAVYEDVREYTYLFADKTQKETAATESAQEVWHVYRDVIYAATQQKFKLIQAEEIGPYRQGTLILEVPIQERSDIPRARELAKERLLLTGQPLSRVMNKLLLISEAITNILKHASEGTLSIVQTPEDIHVFVADNGPGFELKLLPYTILMEGYSTKNSLGQGFTLMLKMADQLLLATSDQGSTLILIFHEEGATH